MTDMGTVEYLLKLYSRYHRYGSHYVRLNELIEYILKDRFGMKIEVTLDDRGSEYNTYHAYNSVCSISVGGCSQYNEN